VIDGTKVLFAHFALSESNLISTPSQDDYHFNPPHHESIKSIQLFSFSRTRSRHDMLGWIASTVRNASGAQRVITLSGFVASSDDPTTAVTVASGKWASLYFEYIAAVGWIYMGKKGN